jgi:hypothetical protein
LAEEPTGAKTRSEAPLEQVFEQRADESGRIKLDRRLTLDEAREQDEQHREHFVRERLKRFGVTPSAPKDAA